jgi:hypothetical protein
MAENTGRPGIPILAAGNEGSYAITTDTRNVIITSAIQPIIDAHMHIMSLNCTPLTLQWATAYLKAGVFGRMMGDGRQEVTQTSAARNFMGWAATLATHDFGRIGQFSTDIIAKLFMGNAKNADFAARLYWLLTGWTRKKQAEQMADANRSGTDSENERAEAGASLGLENLATERNATYTQFVQTTGYYHQLKAPFFMEIALPMDMSYAHYWGLHDLPIYLPALGESYFYYMSDFHCIENGASNYVYEPLKQSATRNRIKELNQANIILHYNTSLGEQIHAYYDRLKEAVNAGGRSVEVPLLRFGTPGDYADILDEAQLGWTFRKKQNVSTMTALDTLMNMDAAKENYLAENNKKYKHYLKKIEGDTTEMFEDYWEQAALHEGAMLGYPLQMLPFYHYDPRRYYPEGKQVDIINALTGDHAFFEINDTGGGVNPTEYVERRLSEDAVEALKRERVKKTYIAPHNFGSKNQPMSAEEYFNGLFFDGIFESTDTDKEKVLTISASKKSHADCLKEYLYPDGPFLGVKVYPPMGYPGDLFSESQRERFEYPAGRFDNYKELFRYCVENDLPVTAHASPMGMTIADGHNYILNDREKHLATDNRDVIAFTTGAISLRNPGAKDSAVYVDKIATHPDHWERLLRTEGLSALKLCLAHFGGLDAWIGKKKERESRKEWVDGVISLINGFSNVYTDISNYNVKPGTVQWTINNGRFQNILRKCTDDEKRMLNRAYSLNTDSNNYNLNSSRTGDMPNARMILRKYGYMNDDVKELAGLLKGKIQGEDKLRWRILMGSDWYMSELDSNYPGKYYSGMFELLAELTRELNEGWDAWHQFSVVNPLLFLGLLKAGADGKPPELEESGTGLKYYELDTGRLETAYANANKRIENEDWLKLAHISSKQKFSSSESLYTANLEKLKRAKIYTAESIKRNGELAILSVW